MDTTQQYSQQMYMLCAFYLEDFQKLVLTENHRFTQETHHAFRTKSRTFAIPQAEYIFREHTILLSI
jgi:hypothetical protein